LYFKIDFFNLNCRGIYKSDGHAVLNTLKQWNYMGKLVKKGEKALLLWGQPKHVERTAEANAENVEVDEFDFFPICYVFSDKQVTAREAK
jgi:hypothetical protein